MACLDSKCAAAVAILDPVLTLSQPPRVTACTGIDAVAHAVETAVTLKRNERSREFSQAAFALCVEAVPQVLAEPDQLTGRERMQLGAAYAGAAIEASMLGAAHAAVNPLTAHFNVVHGHAVGLMLPQVVRFNAVDAAAREIYRQLAVAQGLVAGRVPAECAVDELVKRLAWFVERAGLPVTLAACGVPREALAGALDLALDLLRPLGDGLGVDAVGARDGRKRDAAARGAAHDEAMDRGRLAYSAYVGFMQLMLQLRLQRMESAEFEGYVEHVARTLIPAPQH